MHNFVATSTLSRIKRVGEGWYPKKHVMTRGEEGSGYPELCSAVYSVIVASHCIANHIEMHWKQQLQLIASSERTSSHCAPAASSLLAHNHPGFRVSAFPPTTISFEILIYQKLTQTLVQLFFGHLRSFFCVAILPPKPIYDSSVFFLSSEPLSGQFCRHVMVVLSSFKPFVQKPV